MTAAAPVNLGRRVTVRHDVAAYVALLDTHAIVGKVMVWERVRDDPGRSVVLRLYADTVTPDARRLSLWLQVGPWPAGDGRAGSGLRAAARRCVRDAIGSIDRAAWRQGASLRLALPLTHPNAETLA